MLLASRVKDPADTSDQVLAMYKDIVERNITQKIRESVTRIIELLNIFLYAGMIIPIIYICMCVGMVTLLDFIISNDHKIMFAAVSYIILFAIAHIIYHNIFRSMYMLSELPDPDFNSFHFHIARSKYVAFTDRSSGIMSIFVCFYITYIIVTVYSLHFNIIGLKLFMCHICHIYIHMLFYVFYIARVIYSRAVVTKKELIYRFAFSTIVISVANILSVYM